MEIIRINSSSPYLKSVIDLGDKNSDTLGFLPKVAFQNAAIENKILVAIDEKKNFVGYLLFNHNLKLRLTSITHLCIKEEYRGKNYAKELVKHLKVISKQNSYAIRVHCRRDWKAHSFWPKMGFIAKGEKKGRSKSGSTLTIFLYDHGYSDLFSADFFSSIDDKIHVVIDANIFYDLIYKDSRNKEDSNALLSEWLSSEIELCVTEEIFNEIARSDNPITRERTRASVNLFTIIPFREDISDENQSAIDKVFGDILTEQDHSDKRQIERTVASNVKYFITHDQNLINKSSPLESNVGLFVWTPAELIIHIDRIRRSKEYHPTRLAGLNILINKVGPHEIDLLANTFLWTNEETKSHFLKSLRKYSSNPVKFETLVVKAKEKYLSVIVLNKEDKYILEVPIFRIKKCELINPLSEYLILYIIQKAIEEEISLIKLNEKYLLENIKQILRSYGFVPNGNSYWRLSMYGQYSSDELIQKIEVLKHVDLPDITYLNQLIDSINQVAQINDDYFDIELEKTIWPIKFSNIRFNNFLVPIQPSFALNLFDSNLGNQELFGGKPTQVLITENVYFRSSKPNVLKSPGRILWYISNSKSPYTDIQSIRACSYLNEVIIDKPKTLYQEFKKTGTYSWKQVYDTAKNDINKDIMAFKFSHTELFTFPINLNKIRKIWEETENKNFHPQGPMKISNELFHLIYSIGMKGE
ncbi:GNAT family N-acetyltransferase [Chloroflexota bacterium]|nr:GNAT family N-acetyltransferase [Chloroflexota bacterium]